VNSFDVIVIGAGAAGMMCAIEAGKRGRRVLLVDHAKAPGEKIRISGGGRCNFTNLETRADRFISANPHFCKSALSRYQPADFIALLGRYGIAWHEKTLGQLFCDDSAKQVVEMLLTEMRDAGVTLRTGTPVETLEKTEAGFELNGLGCESLVIACGGKSIPKMGATGFGYEVARKFGLAVTETRPALVPLTLDPGMLKGTAPLSGVSVDALVASERKRFAEAMLFTHRGLSGPAILQVSSYWREGEAISIDMAPGIDVHAELMRERGLNGKQSAASALAGVVPKRLAVKLSEDAGLSGPIGGASGAALKALSASVNAWRFKPLGSEGYRTAEVTLGGVDTAGLDQKTMAARSVPGLYFIGEVVDVTGWLGGYNFQWAWASGFVAGQAV